MSRKPTGPGSFDAFMETQRQQADEPAAQEAHPQSQEPQTDEDVLAEALMAAYADAPARAAIAKIRAAHPEDFDCFIPTMAFMTPICRPDWTKISLPEYLEALYAVIKHADFMAETRSGILRVVQESRKVSSQRPN